MKCYDPSEQFFNLENKIIGIDWANNGDMAIQTTIRKEEDKTLTVIEVKELNKG